MHRHLLRIFETALGSGTVLCHTWKREIRDALLNKMHFKYCCSHAPVVQTEVTTRCTRQGILKYSRLFTEPSLVATALAYLQCTKGDKATF